MNKEITLVVLAAGMGSRFGGLKQVEPFGPNGEFIIDYSIYDAKKAGFDKVVFLIRKHNYDLFKETVGKRVEEYIKVEYAFQEMDDLKEKYHLPEREKPLGTAHAVWCCKDVVDGPFMMINADDFYGYDAFKEGYQFLKNSISDTEYGMVVYDVINTITEHGSVKRGIIDIVDNYINKIVESKIEMKDNKLMASPLDSEEEKEISKDTKVSMNMLLLNNNIFTYIEENMDEMFLNSDNLDTCEYLIPDVLEKGIRENKFRVRALNTDSVWHGVTYKEDKDELVNSINKLIEEGNYPHELWKGGNDEA
ncbi:MAG: nucleotidyltransferase [Bacilli bacterium]|nr:nucleotidyltransferase [Bacilli bacterium]